MHWPLPAKVAVVTSSLLVGGWYVWYSGTHTPQPPAPAKAQVPEVSPDSPSDTTLLMSSSKDAILTLPQVTASDRTVLMTDSKYASPIAGSLIVTTTQPDAQRSLLMSSSKSTVAAPTIGGIISITSQPATPEPPRPVLIGGSKSLIIGPTVSGAITSVVTPANTQPADPQRTILMTGSKSFSGAIISPGMITTTAPTTPPAAQPPLTEEQKRTILMLGSKSGAVHIPTPTAPATATKPATQPAPSKSK